MRWPPVQLLLLFALALAAPAFASKHAQKVTVCSLQQNGLKFLNSRVKFRAVMELGSEHSVLREGNCFFFFASGDDYQDFGNRYAVDENDQWRLMQKILDTPMCPPVNARAVKAIFRGTVIRTPPTGTIPENQMPMEVVIQSVSHVENAIKRCINRPK